MDKFIDLISKEVKQAFGAAGYEEELGKVTLSNRPDLCEYQCNGAMAGAKRYHKAPLAIAEDVAGKLKESNVFSEVAAVAPGFLNLKVKETFLKEYLEEMRQDEKFGVATPGRPQKIIVDYGGPNVAKPLHVGHLRSAIIGESIKRICRFMGHDVLGDIHMGDWGLQMGLIITELRQREPELVYFDETYQGDYPEEAPFTISELEEIYPTASAKSKEDAAYKAKAMEDTYRLQNGVPGIRALWQHIMKVSIADLKKNYAALNVEFDLWKGESDVHNIIPGMVEEMKKGGFAHESEGALVVDVKEDTDTKEIPPCMILKSDGASLYNTTDLATIVDRMATYQPDKLIYLADKRQDLYFEQVFRCARKTGLVKPETQLVHIGFGTMNGRDGKPFKTRDGGVMRLENLIREINEEMYGKIADNPSMSQEEAKETSRIVALSAVKYGDLSNQASKDYIFDMERFTSFEGDTGPYILYTIVRIKSILAKYEEQTGRTQTESGKAHTETGRAESASDKKNVALREAASASEKDLMLEIAKFNAMMEAAYEEVAPHRICAYIYDLANAFNHFYHETKILAEADREKQEGWIALLQLTKAVLETSIDLLGFSAPERM
ncbi:MAG: arginine--tRNA ligase [Muribaculaceae bacterium]|nr:arginine--tRNA ligase [Muribaculaceae bacterium]